MFKNIRYIHNNFLDEKERNKIIVDSMLHKRYTFPQKSSIGKEIKHVARQANKHNDWHFHLDRIESIKVYSFNKFMVWQATMPAVSVLSLLFPKDIGMKSFLIANSTSSLEKSPSGPIKINAFSPI